MQDFKKKKRSSIGKTRHRVKTFTFLLSISMLLILIRFIKIWVILFALIVIKQAIMQITASNPKLILQTSKQSV